MSQDAAILRRDAGGWRRSDGLSERLLQVVDIGLAGVIFFAPLFMGGRHPVGRFVLTLLACVILCAWLARQSLIARGAWIRSGADWLLAAGVLVVACQLVPLPAGVLNAVSPSIQEKLPLWAGAADPAEGGSIHLGQWSQISLYPAATQGGLVLLLAYAAIFVVTVQRIQSLSDIQRLLRWIALAVGAMSVLGLLSYFLSNGKFLWVYLHPFRDTANEVHGPFENQNHFAHFVALGIGPLIWWIQQSFSRKKRSSSFGSSSQSSKTSGRYDHLVRFFGGGALALAMFAGLLTFSRGGVIVILAAGLVTVGLFVWTRLLTWRALAALGVAALLLAGALMAHGAGGLASELDTVGELSVDTIDRGESRRRLWDADLKAAADYKLLGAGVGTHVEVYPTYYDEPTWLEFEYAESGYLQVLVSAGGVGLVLVLCAILLCAWWGADGLRRCADPAMTAALGAVIASLFVSVLHSIFDFVWFIPACASVTVILAACLCRLRQLARYGAKSSRKKTNPKGHIALPKPVWGLAAAASAVLALFMVGDRFGPACAAGHWNQFFGLSLASSGYDPHSRNRGMSTSYGEVDHLSPNTIETLMRHLENTLASDPDHARAHLRMASICIRRFELAQLDAENAMALSQIRDAALASNFSSAEAQNEWLNRAIGESRQLLDQALHHARRAVELCPLQGKGYIYLSQLAFLESPDPGNKHQYVAQALTVRPYSGDVLIPAGAEALFVGDQPKAMELWKKAFHQGPQYQQQIAATLAPTTPADFMLANFRPDLDGTHVIYTQYQQVGLEQEAHKAALVYVSQVEAEAEKADRQRAASLWHKAQGVYRDLGDSAKAVQCATKAVSLDPNDFVKRKALARRLMEQGMHQQAEEHLRWCLRRKPDDEALQNALQTARREAMRAAAGFAEDLQQPPQQFDQGQQLYQPPRPLNAPSDASSFNPSR